MQTFLLQSCKNDVEAYRASLTPTEYLYAKQVIYGLEKIIKQRAHIATLTQESKRNQYITDLTGLIAEPGLLPGKTSEEIEESIDIRINSLISSYHADKEKGDTLFFFKNGFIGPPCFNGRLDTLEHYAYEKHGFKTKLFFEYHLDWDQDAVALEDLMHHVSTSYDEPPTQKELSQYSKTPIGDQIKAILLRDPSGKIYKRACEFFTGK